jgi:Tol biopolymer transport system component
MFSASSTTRPILCGLLLAAGMAVTPAAQATFPGDNGRIVFGRPDAQGNLQVWTARADMSHQRQLTSGDASSGFATWSPRAPMIAFDSNQADPDLGDDVEINDVFTMRADGSGAKRITSGEGFAGDPSWTPDGTRLVFVSDEGDYPAKQGVYSSRRDGSDLRRITTLPEGANSDTAPRVSPDGRRIVFTRYFPADTGRETSALYLVDSDGSHLRRIRATARLHPGDADWSPDGRYLVFEADGPREGSRGDIYTIRRNGTQLRNLTGNVNGRQGSSDPVFSPDGKRILFVSGTFPTDGAPKVGLAIMRTDGSKRTMLPGSPAFEDQPDWRSNPQKHR